MNVLSCTKSALVRIVFYSSLRVAGGSGYCNKHRPSVGVTLDSELFIKRVVSIEL